MTSETTTTLSGALKALRHPISAADILRKRRQLRRELLNQENLIPVRIAILGGSTTAELKSMLELFLLSVGIQATFYESGYNRYSEEVLSRNRDLWGFKPEIVLIHTTLQNLREFPAMLESEAEVEGRVRREMERFESLWERIHSELGALIIQNNFDLPVLRPMGNLEASESYGRVNFLMRMNSEFVKYARNHRRFLINDILYLSAQVGLASWFSQAYWYSFHMALSPIATVSLAQNVSGMVKAVYGKSKKCLVLDLDNTLWGGVIGDDGVQNLVLGKDHPLGEAFVDFQQYVKDLKQRGIMLAVCSKNDPENAKAGFSHPDSVLKLDDFSVFKANWEPKPQNIRAIAAELNIGLDSMVFVDDNPAERALVGQELPVAVPEVGSDVSHFAHVLEQERYFEVEKLVQEDLGRAAYYASNAQRSAFQSDFRNYDDFLASLEMTAEIEPFRPPYLERITQLINKTNQFNLTTRRYTSAEVESIATDGAFVTLYGRLADKFGDNGLVSVIIGRAERDALHLEAWLMSCRVFGRQMELAMFDALIDQCKERGIRRITGVYIPSPKNNVVAQHYASLGFTRATEASESSQIWSYEIPTAYTVHTRFIRPAKSARVSSTAMEHESSAVPSL